jgi:2,5-diamino-6-(ribosylamino)-4(3H)-pyrimidinone 5'-phosphate reductase
MRVFVNAAVSADGKLSTRRREQVAISGEDDFARVDRLRAESDAVMVGVGTVLADDPSLVRHDEAHRREVTGDAPPPARVVADSRCRTPTEANVLVGTPTSYVLTTKAAPGERRDALSGAGAEVVVAGEDRIDLPAALDALERRGVDDLMVEGGGELIFSLFDAGLVDELSTFVGPTVIGGRNAPTLADGDGFVDTHAFPELELVDVEELDGGVVLAWDVVG